MKLSRIKKAFSLTELLIVLVIIAILFAAMLPMMTKRRAGDSIANEPVWSFVANNDQKDAFYDPGAIAQTSTAYIGVSPNNLSNNVTPYSKVVVKARPNQNMLQFRYGSGIGRLTGLFAMDTNGNTMMTSRLNAPASKNYWFTSSSYNTVAGVGAFSQANSPYYNVAIGSNSLYGTNSGGPSKITAVGSSTGRYISYEGNDIFLGANVGRGRAGAIKDTIGIGSTILANMNDSAGANNVFLGYLVASSGFNDTIKSINNTIVGSSYYGTVANNNTIIGYDTYTKAPNFATHINVAGGYGACDSMQYQTKSGTTIASSSAGGTRTCLGYGTARSRGSASYTTPYSFENDKFEHIFLGGSPNNFGGRSVLEVHNTNLEPKLKALPRLGPTVVLNSHLVVRGNVFFPTASDGVLRTFVYSTYFDNDDERGKDRCGRRCLFGRKEWRDSKACSWFLNIISALVGALMGLAGCFTFGASWALTVAIAVGSGGLGLGTGAAIFNGKDYNRIKDPSSFSYVTYGTQTSSSSPVSLAPSCTGSTNGTYPDSKYCPDLKLSDIRLKENISDNTEALNKLMLVTPYNYTFKNDKDKTPQVGVIAQDLQKYFPESVSEQKDGYLAIRWDEMFFVMINSVKELNSKVETVLYDINLLEKDSDRVAHDQDKIQNKIDKLNSKLDKLEK